MIRLYVFIFLLTLARVKTVQHDYEERVRQAQEKYTQEQQVTDSGVNEFTAEINDEVKPEVTKVTLTDPYENGVMKRASVKDIYKIEYMPSGVVGLVGPPVRVDYEGNLNELRLTFWYEPGELRGMPERNFIILHETAAGAYEQVGTEEINTEQKTVSVTIYEPGIYLLADRYQWYTVWGEDMSEYAYTVDPLEYESDWERECDTGSIMEIADVEWALQNGPYFHVSTPEQLAGVVWYANAYNDLGVEQLYLYLEEDIDLAGYDWVPMGWGGAMDIKYNGLVDGQGHKISNLDIHLPANNYCAFIGRSTGLEVRDITFENAAISGGYYAGIVGGEIYISPVWTNVHVSGRINEAYGEVGSIIGREAGTAFKDCSADVIYSRGGTEKQLEYFSQRLEWLAETPETEDFTLSLEEDGRVSRSTGGEENFMNLMWHVEVDGVQVLQRMADNETSFHPIEILGDRIQAGSECRIWLVAYTGRTYARVSTILEYPTK